ncbi:hypothetical protein [Xanthobacter sp.]|uniref:hypothetical protein n=1 Tax=Xanthobacter sp. TaxID=35809 RepID=UPI0025E022F1|nr:hypothetical protein [Xanthobacter sp.]
MSSFEFRKSWIPSGDASELDATMAQLGIEVGDKLITQFRGEYEAPSEFLEMPLYGIAAWIAANWWSLLWEPRKNEDARDGREFLARHCLMAAQQGFALPDLTLISGGASIHLRARARHAPFADVRFVNGADIFLPRADVERELKGFVSSVVARLEKAGIAGTDLQEDWGFVINTSKEEESFCKAVGALGISPYAVSDGLASKIEQCCDALGESLLFDLCLASSTLDLREAAKNAVTAKQAAERSSAADISALEQIDPPADNFSLKAWQVGVDAARKMRASLNIAEDDPQGSRRFMEVLGIDLSEAASGGVDAESAPVLGAAIKDGKKAYISLLQKRESQRRFTAARGAYLAWTARDERSARLLTWAVTRDQQASRAFAAEMTAPRAFLREELRKKIGLSKAELIGRAASMLSISDDVVRKQAANNGLI